MIQNRRSFIAFAIGAVLVGRVERGDATPVAYDYTGRVTEIDQGGNADLCWLAAAAMMQSFSQIGNATMEATANSLGDPFLTLYRNGKFLPFALVDELAKRLGVRKNGFASFTVDWWADRLKNGPLWVGGLDPNAGMGHVRVLIGMKGDTTDVTSLRVTYIDPAGARRVETGFIAFIQFYENLPTQNPKLVNQIFSFG